MSLGNCIPGMLERGEIDPARAQRMSALFTKLERYYAGSMGADAAAAVASEKTLEQMARDAARRKRLTLMQAAAQQRAVDAMETFKGKRQEAALALLDHDWRGRADYSNVEGRRKAIMARAHAGIEGVLEKHKRSRLTGMTQHADELDDLARERFGQSTGNASAKELAEAFGEAAEGLRQRFNAAGGDIGKLADWGLPTRHDSVAVRQAAIDDPRFQALERALTAARKAGDVKAEAAAGEAMTALASRTWRDQVTPRLDRERMIDRETGLPFTDAALDEVLDGVYRTIRSDGWETRPAGGQGRASLANQRVESRFLHFRSADDWLWYNDRYGGGGSVFDAMVGHIEGMARDVAHMEILGPNPTATVRFLNDTVERARQAAPDRAPLKDRAEGALLSIDQLYAATSGALSVPVDEGWARRFGSVRSTLVAAQLGSASLSAITDVGWQALTRIYNGLPVMTQTADFARQFSKAERRESVRVGLIAEDASRLLAAQNRYVETEVIGRKAAWLAERVMNLSFLSQWTQAQRWSFGMGFMGHLATMADRPLTQLPARFQRTLRRYGIDEAGWEAIRATPLFEPNGRALLRPEDVSDARLGDRLLEMILTETDAATPTVTAKGRAMLSFGQRPGTLGGELIRSIGQYKSFGVSLLLTHGARFMSESAGGRAAYAAMAMGFGTTLGALSLWLRDLRNGQDPRPANTAAFWGQAVLQGVGFGPFGDYLNAITSERTNSLAEAVAGATTGGISDLGMLTIGNAVETAAWAIEPDEKRDGTPKTWNEQTHAGRELVNFAKRYTPGSNLFYLRTATERMFFDQIQMQLDPNYAQSWAARSRARRERGSPEWWAPGEMTPGRQPDSETIWGDDE